MLNWNFAVPTKALFSNLENCALTWQARKQPTRMLASAAGARLARRSHRQADDVPGSGREGKIKGQRRSDASRRADVADGRIPRMFEIVEPKRTAVS